MNIICSILNFNPSETERGCCGDPDRIITEGSCGLEIFDLEIDFDVAARAWANAQKTSAESILMINGKIYEKSGLNELQLEDYALEDLSWTEEERAMGLKLTDAATEHWKVWHDAQQAALKKQQEAWAAKAELDRKAAEERLRQGKLEQFKKLKNELGL
jgi:hypothetical protein